MAKPPNYTVGARRSSRIYSKKSRNSTKDHLLTQFSLMQKPEVENQLQTKELRYLDHAGCLEQVSTLQKNPQIFQTSPTKL